MPAARFSSWRSAISFFKSIGKKGFGPALRVPARCCVSSRNSRNADMSDACPRIPERCPRLCARVGAGGIEQERSRPERRTEVRAQKRYLGSVGLFRILRRILISVKTPAGGSFLKKNYPAKDATLPLPSLVPLGVARLSPSSRYRVLLARHDPTRLPNSTRLHEVTTFVSALLRFSTIIVLSPGTRLQQNLSLLSHNMQRILPR